MIKHAKIGAIFDCDGTLLDTAGGWRAVEYELGRACNHQVSTDEVKLLATFTLTETATYFHETYNLGASVNEVVSMIDETLVSYYRTQARPRAGVPEFLEGLAAAGVPLVVASSSPQRYLQPGLAHAGIYDYFSAVFSTDDVGAPKRQPTIYEHAARFMKTDKSLTWGFEDSLYAVRTLVAAGFQCAGCYDCDNSATIDELRTHATLVIPSFEGYSAQAFLAHATAAAVAR